MGRGTGFGKTILFGEHFVCYDVPAVVAALSMQAVAEVRITESDGVSVRDERPDMRGYIEKKKAMQAESLERILKHLGRKVSGMEIHLAGDLPAMSGIGASGASSVAIVRALSEELGLGLSDEAVNLAALEAERAYHGEKTAGLDNVASTYGGVIFFTKVKPVEFEKLDIKDPVEIVIADTGVVANTKGLINGVAERRERSPDMYQALIDEAGQVIVSGRDALMRSDWETLGRLFNENHRLLQAIGVGSPELDYLVDLGRKHGAVGAKQTGSGGGGCTVCLTPGKELQDRVAEAMEKEGYFVVRTRIARP